MTLVPPCTGAKARLRDEVSPAFPTTWKVILAKVSSPLAGTNVALFAANRTVPVENAALFVITLSKGGTPSMLTTRTTLALKVSANRYETTFVPPALNCTGTGNDAPGATEPGGEPIRTVLTAV